MRVLIVGRLVRYMSNDFRNILDTSSITFCRINNFFGTKGGYYDSDDYTGDGCAHDVKR